MSILRYKMANNVRAFLSASITSAATSITYTTPTAPYNNFPDPLFDSASGGLGVATLVDSLSTPTVTEIVTYASLTDNHNGTFTLGGVTRGVDGTTAAAFGAGAAAIQALNVACFNNPVLSLNNNGQGATATGWLNSDTGYAITSTPYVNTPGFLLNLNWDFHGQNQVLQLTNGTNISTIFTVDPPGPCWVTLRVISAATGTAPTIAATGQIHGAQIPSPTVGGNCTIWRAWFDGAGIYWADLGATNV